MMHPAIEQVMQTGYPTSDYLTHERKEIHYPAVEGHPNKDIFGSVILADDNYFMDANGQAVLLDNMRDYLTEIVGVVFYEAN